jgi:uncharacterized protein (TIGR04255 family)
MNWEPVRADHAIDRVVASITLPKATDANTFDELVVAGRKIAAGRQLTDRVDLQDAIEVPPGQNVVIALGSMTPPRRVVFRRLEANTNTPVEELSIGARQLAFTTVRYRRWADFYHLIITVMAALDQVCPITQNAQLVRLEYIDRFQSAPGGADHFEVLSRDSIFLTPVVRDKDGALHVHSGWFDFETPRIRRLTNVNIDVNDTPVPPPPDARRSISVISMGQFEALDGALDNPLQRLEALHDYLKATFGSIITQEAADRVALNAA